MNEKQTQVLEILAEVLERPASELKPEQHLKDDLEMDSAQSLELLSEIEDRFEIEIDEISAAKAVTVGDVLALAEAS